VIAVWSRRITGQLIVSGGLVLLPGCQESLPVGPSDLSNGIVVYEHANYLGESAHITQDIKDLKDFKGPCLEFEGGPYGGTTKDVWNDCISSIRVAPGWRATLYRDDDFKGDRLELTEDVPNLEMTSGRCDKGGFNDCVTSLHIIQR
jgi:hypothetical protein